MFGVLGFFEGKRNSIGTFPPWLVQLVPIDPINRTPPEQEGTKKTLNR